MGLLDSIGSVLTNPEVEMLLPAALGALGGGLTSPRLAGSRGAIGSALMGGAQGLEKGMSIAQQQPLAQAQTQEAQMRTKYLEMQNKQMQLQTTNDEVWNKSIDKYAAALPADQRDQFTMLAKGADKAQRLEAVKYFTQIQALPQTYKTLSAMTGKPEEMFHAFQPEDAHALLLKVMETAADGRKPQIQDTTSGLYMVSIDPDNPSKSKIDPLMGKDGKPLMGRDKTPAYGAPVMLESGNLAMPNRKTGTLTDTGVAGVSKEPMVAVADPTSPTGVTYVPRSAAAGEAAPAKGTGAATEAGAMAGMRGEYDRMAKANDIVTAKNAMFNDPATGKPIPGMPVAPTPYPGLAKTFDEYANSAAGKKFKEAYLGRAPSAAGEAPKTVESKATAVAEPKNSLAKVTAGAKDSGGNPVKEGVTYTKKDGTTFHIKDGYAYPGPAPK